MVKKIDNNCTISELVLKISVHKDLKLHWLHLNILANRISLVLGCQLNLIILEFSILKKLFVYTPLPCFIFAIQKHPNVFDFHWINARPPQDIGRYVHSLKVYLRYKVGWNI